MTAKRLPFSRYWAIDEQAMDALLVRMRSVAVNWSLVTAQHSDSAMTSPANDGSKFERVGDTAVISLIGETVKYPLPGFLMEIFGLASTITFQDELRAAVTDETIDRIIVFVDSPGGEALGTADAADALFAARQSGKKTVSYISGLGASAGYYIASQAETVIASSDAIVGSIGTFMVIDDWSQFFEESGVKRRVVRAGKFKGAGVMGTEVTQEHIDEFQRLVDAHNELFVAAVARGRGFGMKAAGSLNDGRVHVGKEAERMKLIDSVQSWDAVIRGSATVGSTSNKIRAAVVVAGETAGNSPPYKDGGSTMSGETTVTPAAQATNATAGTELKSSAVTVAEMKQALPDSNAEFRESCIEASLTLVQAKDSWMAELRNQVAASNKAQASAETAKAESDAQLKMAQGRSGQPVLGAGTGGPTGEADAVGDPIAAFDGAVAAKMSAGAPKHLATRAVCKEQPELRDSYVQAMNLRKVG